MVMKRQLSGTHVILGVRVHEFLAEPSDTRSFNRLLRNYRWVALLFILLLILNVVLASVRPGSLPGLPRAESVSGHDSRCDPMPSAN
jgi:hypothetical protein